MSFVNCTCNNRTVFMNLPNPKLDLLSFLKRPPKHGAGTHRTPCYAASHYYCSRFGLFSICGVTPPSIRGNSPRLCNSGNWGEEGEGLSRALPTCVR